MSAIDSDPRIDKKIMRSSWYVWVFILVYAAMIPLQRLTGAFEFQTVTFAFSGLLGAYIGIDGLAGIMKTGVMPAGKKFDTNRRKLEAVVIATLLLVIEGLGVQYLVQSPDPGIELSSLPITHLVVMSIFCTTVFVGVEKGKTANENRGPVGDQE